MPTMTSKRPRSDASVRSVMTVLRPYQQSHARAKIDVYRHSKFSLRIRVIDPDFSGLSLAERDDPLWKLLGELPDDVKYDISTLLLLTPEECASSLANFDFENPLPSKLKVG